MIVNELYNSLRLKYRFEHLDDAKCFFMDKNTDALGQFLNEAFKIREDTLKSFNNNLIIIS